MTTIHIGFLDWNSGGLLNGEYNRVEVSEVNETTVRDAARELVENEYGYWGPVDEMADDDEEPIDKSLYSPAVERYWVHAETCPEAAEIQLVAKRLRLRSKRAVHGRHRNLNRAPSES